MCKNGHKYLAFSSVNFFESLYSSKVVLSNSIFYKISFFFLTLKNICSIEFLENKEIERAKSISSPMQILIKVHLGKLEKLPKKTGKIQKFPIYFIIYPHINTRILPPVLTVLKSILSSTFHGREGCRRHEDMKIRIFPFSARRQPSRRW